MFVAPNLTWRILSMSFALGGITLLAAAELRTVPNKRLVDRLLLVLTFLAAANFFVRTLVILTLHGPVDVEAGFHQSVYWTTVMLSHALLSILLALTLITATAQRIIDTLRMESRTDPLSGLLNRRGFEEQAKMLLARSERHTAPAALVLGDLDYFKDVNDTYGHASGDRVIAAFGNRLRQVAGDSFLIGRIGGEEFAVFLPATSASAARLFAEGVRASFAATPVDGLPEHVRVTASFGIAVHGASEPLTSLLSRADHALYDAKRRGRDSVSVWLPDLAQPLDAGRGYPEAAINRRQAR
jgi:diguanylate cyclase (GGDEF)-like protein